MATEASENVEEVTDVPSGYWLFVGNTGDVSEVYFQGSKVGDIVGWRHGSDSHTLRMKPGHVAVIYITDGKEAHIRGLGIILAVREPFLLDTRIFTDANAFVQRIPILITDLFEDTPIDAKALEKRTGQRLARLQGSVHEVRPNSENELLLQLRQIGRERSAFTMDNSEKASAVARSNLWAYLESSSDLAFFGNYISRDRRQKMLESGDTPEGDLSETAVVSKIAALWRTEIGGNVANLQPITDNPAGAKVDDKLQRYPMAEILARRLRSIFRKARADWKQGENQKQTRWDFQVYPGETADAAPFTLLVDSPWGGGKSSFANFLGQVLSTPDTSESDSSKRDEDKPWTIVTFNAWRHQHVRPVWWVLYGYILNALLKRRRDDEGPESASLMWISQKLWQLATWQNMVASVAWLLACAVALLIYQSSLIKGDGTNLTPGGAVGLVGLLAIAGLPIVATFRSLITSVGHSLNPGRASAEVNYSLGLDDPLERFRRHFRRTLAKQRTPVLLIVDDLDRCQSDFVVDLVQGLQTLLRSQHLFVLLLGDRSWIETCFDVEFEAMDIDKEDGRKSNLGRKYVEKALQMSLTLPQPTIEQRLNLLDSVTWVEPVKAGERDVNGVTPNHGRRHQQTDNRTNVEVDPTATPKPQADSTQQEAIRQREQDVEARMRWRKARDLVDSDRNDAAIRRTVLKFVGFFPNNPRQIKRIVNTISFYQAVAIGLNKIAPTDDEWEKFYIWIIAYLEFNDHWAAVSRDPTQLSAIRADQKLKGSDRNFLELLNFKKGPGEESGQSESEITIADVKKFSEIIPPPW